MKVLSQPKPVSRRKVCIRHLESVFACLVIFIGGCGCGWMLRNGFSDAAVRRWHSNFQHGTQLYFDENCCGNELYSAQVTAFDSGLQIYFNGNKCVRGSTFPDLSGTNDFPVVAATTIHYQRGIHYGTVTNEVFNMKHTPALILNPGAGTFLRKQGLAVPTININHSPNAGVNFGQAQATQITFIPAFLLTSKVLPDV